MFLPEALKNFYSTDNNVTVRRTNQNLLDTSNFKSLKPVNKL